MAMHGATVARAAAAVRCRTYNALTSCFQQQQAGRFKALASSTTSALSSQHHRAPFSDSGATYGARVKAALSARGLTVAAQAGVSVSTEAEAPGVCVVSDDGTVVTSRNEDLSESSDEWLSTLPRGAYINARTFHRDSVWKFNHHIEARWCGGGGGASQWSRVEELIAPRSGLFSKKRRAK